MGQAPKADAESNKATNVDALPVGVFSTDAQGNITHVNPAILELCGIDEEAIRDGSWLDQIAEEFRPEVERLWRRLFTEQIGYQLEYSITLPNGRVRWLLVSAVCDWDEDEVFKGAVGTLTDISALKRVESEMEKLSLRNHALLTTIPDIVAEVDGNKRYTWMNQAAKAFFGEDAIGKSADEFFVGEQETFRTVEPLFSGEADTINVQSWQRRGDGEERLLDWHCTPIVDASGVVTGAISTARDITEEHQMLLKLRESEAGFQTLTSVAPAGVFRYDESGDLVFTNQAYFDICGISDEEAKSGKWVERLHPVDRARLLAEREQAALENRGYKVECRVYQKDGSVRSVLTNVEPIIDSEGASRGRVGVLIDISHLKQAEEELRTLVEVAPEAVLVFNTETDGIELVNERALGFFKCNRETLLAAHPSVLCPEFQPDGQASEELALERIGQALESDEVVTFELEMIDANGHTIPAEVSMVRLPAPRGHLVRASIVDISARKAAERAIRETEARFRTVVENAPVIFWTTDTEGVITFSRGKGLEIVGLRPDEAVGVNVYEAYAVVEGSAQAMDAALSGQEARYSGYHPEIDTLLECTLTPLRDGNGKITGVIGVAYDLTEIHRTQRALQESEERHRATLDAASQLIALLNVDGELREVNQAILDFTGKSRSDLIGRPIWESPSFSHSAELVSKIKNAVEVGSRGKSTRVELETFNGKNQPCIIDFSVNPEFDGEGNMRYLVASCHDITERVLKDRALRESEAKYRSVVSSLAEGIVVMTPDEKFVYSNLEARRILGLTEADIQGRDGADPTWIGLKEDGLIFPADEYPILRSLRHGDECDGVMMGIERPDASKRWITINSRPIFSADGESITGAVATFEDVTDQKLTEEALNALHHATSSALSGKEFFDALTRQVCESFDVEYAYVSRASTLNAEEMENVSFYSKGTMAEPNVFTRDGTPCDAVWGNEILVIGDGVRERFPHAPFLDTLPVRGYIGVPLFNSDHEPIGILAVLTERPLKDTKRLEMVLTVKASRAAAELERLMIDEELHRTRNTMMEAQRIASFGDWEWNIRTGDLHWSAEIYRIFGLQPNEFGASYEAFLERVHPEDRQRVIDAVNDAVENGADYSIDHRVVWPSGEVRCVHEEGVVYRGSEGEPLKMIGVVHDITERMHRQREIQQLNESLEQRVIERTDELLIAKEEAERANLAKTEFHSRISHELRTPLNAVLGFSQLLLSDKRDPLSNGQQALLSRVLSSGQHLLDLINDVLDLSQIESGRIDLSIGGVNLLSQIGSAIEMVRHLAERKQITLHFDQSEYPQTDVLADVIRLRQVLLNLFSNAIKYNNEGGEVFVTVERVESTARIGIRDTGKGISPDYIDSVFEPFNRLGMKHSGIEGTGIGLAITKRIVDLMNGSIEVESTPGEGSTFYLTLPAVDTTDKGTTELLSQAELGGHGSTQDAGEPCLQILLIEDNDANALIIEKLIAKLFINAKVIVHESAESGLDYLKGNKVDLILMDLGLPRMSGQDAIKIIRADSEDSGLPVIAVTANVSPEKRLEALRDGFDSYIEKPVNFVEFERVLTAFVPALVRA